MKPNRASRPDEVPAEVAREIDRTVDLVDRVARENGVSFQEAARAVRAAHEIVFESHKEKHNP